MIPHQIHHDLHLQHTRRIMNIDLALTSRGDRSRTACGAGRVMDRRRRSQRSGRTLLGAPVTVAEKEASRGVGRGGGTQPQWSGRRLLGAPVVATDYEGGTRGLRGGRAAAWWRPGAHMGRRGWRPAGRARAWEGSSQRARDGEVVVEVSSPAGRDGTLSQI
jgi:hypothetical protein